MYSGEEVCLLWITQKCKQEPIRNKIRSTSGKSCAWIAVKLKISLMMAAVTDTRFIITVNCPSTPAKLKAKKPGCLLCM